MANRIELPDDLLLLIEKREGDERRAEGAPDALAIEAERRSGEDRRSETASEFNGG